MNRVLSRFGLMVLSAIVGGMVGCDRSDPPVASDQRVATAPVLSNLAQARAAMSRGDLPSAQSAIAAHLLSSPEDPIALELAGDIAAAPSDPDPLQAIELYESAIEHSNSAAASLYEKLGRQWMNAGSPYDAVEVLRRSLAAHPDNGNTRADLAGLVASLGMVQEAADHLRWLLRRGRGGMNELIMLADLNVPQTDRAICEYAIARRPDDLRPKYPLALTEVYEGKFESAAITLAQVVEKHPDFAPASACLGRALVEVASPDQIRRWSQQLPETIDRWPLYWVAAGLWAERNDQPQQAAQAFWNAVRIDDCHGEALTHLATNLSRLGRDEEARLVAARAADVNVMRDAISSLFSWRKNSQAAAIKVAGAMNDLGRVWEAEAWARASLAMTQEIDPNARQVHREMRAQLTSTTPWQLPEKSVVSRIDLSGLSAFAWSAGSAIAVDPDREEVGPTGARFADQAASRGLIHTCSISKSTPESSIAIYQSNAGGAGVIDFDLDGWPDVYLTVVDGQPLKRNSSPNRLHRNLAGTFTDATEFAGVGDRGYSQGVAVADFNEDGFPDLLVGNIGGNRLYQNNGDGTFEDVTSTAGLDGDRWTSSVTMADFDGDGTCDLFEVNYCGGDQVYTQSCIDDQVNAPRSCSPLVFQAERDRVWRGHGDGTFTDVTDDWLAGQAPGHGLGVIVGDLDAAGGIELYVANDMTANQYWSGSGAGDTFRFLEQAAVRGLAVNSRSLSQASMGMAVGDADEDGDLDIFLTHFSDDYNTLYEQIKPGAWFDRSSNVGLAEASRPMLAFGTEWIDVDNDGRLELLVANGNVDDFSHQGHPLRMHPQLFARGTGGKFRELERQTIGPYFEREVVGRALATLDLDRDGMTDAVVTHLFDPVAALVNQTPTESRSVRLFLRGTSSSRDVIGSIVAVSVGASRRSYQLTAGDGFQCSNERCLSIGLGATDAAREVVVKWPSGATESIGSLDAGGEYLVVEGEGEPFPLNSP